METKELTNEIARFCFKYRLFDKSITKREVKEIIEDGLDDSEFVETLINKIIASTKNRKDIDVKQQIELFLKLEKLRLELKYHGGIKC